MRQAGYLALWVVMGLLFPLAILAALGAYIYESVKLAQASRAIAPMACGIDADCPPGYVCVNGRCLPEPA